MKKYFGFYIAAVTCFILIILGVAEGGNLLEASKKGLVELPDMTLVAQIKQLVKSNIMGGSGLFLIKLLIVLAATKTLSFVFRKFGQPGVIGEILAGIILGPSLLGLFFPEYLNFVFPKEGMEDLHMISRLGLLLFMFIVGMELNLGKMQKQAHEALLISHAGILFPFTMGVGLAYFMYVDLAPNNVYFMPFALFMGIAMGITAFPVLASILRERGMMHTPIGSLAITAAAVDDITAWCVFAGVIAIAKAGSFAGGIFTIILSTIYLLAMFKLVRPALKKWYAKLSPDRNHNINTLVVSFAVLLASSLISKVIGVHSLFGAFMAGVIMPGDLKFRKFVTERTEYVSVILLLPLFFAYNGLRTQIGLLNTPHMWMWFGIIMVVAVTGKLAGSAITARYLGQTLPDSLRLGVLMNTRGLMELIVLNIGLDMGILTPEIFTMMVLMALATTFMTGPLLSLIDRIWKKSETPQALPAETEEPEPLTT